MLHRTLSLRAGAISFRPSVRRCDRRASNQLLIEKHLSNIYRRETFPRHSDDFLAATGVIRGFGPRGHLVAPKAPAAPLNDAG
jgi:3-dehydroquinate dehydratase